MSPAETFYICIAIALAIFIIPCLIVGDGIALLIVIFPAVLAENITGETGLDFGRKSPVYLLLFWIFVLSQVVLIASVLFGIYCLFWGYPIAIDNTGSATLLDTDIAFSQLLNKILLVIEVYFTLMFIYYSFKHKEAFKQLKKSAYIFNRILPLFIFPLTFTYLIATGIYLSSYPSEDLGRVPRIAGYITAAYFTYALGKTIFIYSRNFRHGISGFTFTQALQLIVSIGFNISYLHFFYQIYSMIKN